MWGAPDSSPAWCLGCGEVGREWMERKRLAGFPPPPAGAVVRICLPCYRQGWRVTEPKELGAWWWSRSSATEATVARVRR